MELPENKHVLHGHYTVYKGAHTYRHLEGWLKEALGDFVFPDRSGF